MTPQEQEYRTIELTKGYKAIVDAADYDDLIKFSWHATPRRDSAYAYRSVYVGTDSVGTKKYIHIAMHQQILGIFGRGRKCQCDHINHNMLDNRRSNLRVATPAQNVRHRRKQPNKSSRYLGVSRFRNKWAACIRKDYKTYHLGTYFSEIEAAKAYDAAAEQYFGEFAMLNFSLK